MVLIGLCIHHFILYFKYMKRWTDVTDVYVLLETHFGNTASREELGT